MKKFVRYYAVDTFSLFVASRVADGIVLESGLKTLLVAGLGFMVASILAKPIINILLLPLNLVTFGVFRWVSAAIVLYLVTLLVPGFKVAKFVFEGYSSKWIDIPQISFEGALAYVAFALIISVITSAIYWLVK